RLLKRIRDFAQVHHKRAVTPDVVEEALGLLDIDKRGLDTIDRHVLRVMVDQFEGGPVGLSTLSAVLSEEQRTLEEVVEPFLIQVGMLRRTPRGRVVTQRAYEHLGIDEPAEQTALL
ncbi:MAG: Holliday junction DNA helicase RuvB C-terminal domain-containing protein, partial [Patescibacteria group bacterium]